MKFKIENLFTCYNREDAPIGAYGMFFDLLDGFEKEQYRIEDTLKKTRKGRDFGIFFSENSGRGYYFFYMLETPDQNKRMTLDQAIEYYDKKSKEKTVIDSSEEYLQLCEWLKELKSRRSYEEDEEEDWEE